MTDARADANLPSDLALDAVGRLILTAVGAWSLPTGWLVLPAVPGAEAALAALLTGDLETPVPAAWAFFVDAARGDLAEARAALAGDSSLAARYNRFALSPSEEALTALRAELPAASPLATLAEVVAFSCGWGATLPAPELCPEATVRAWVRLAYASAEIEQEQLETATEHLAAGFADVVDANPAFAARIGAQLAEVESVRDLDAGIAHYRAALRRLEGCRFEGLAAELWLSLGCCLHQRAGTDRPRLLEAVQAYQEALGAGLAADANPEGYALAQNNLGLAYLAMPMREAGDALRAAVAIQSFREALRIYTRNEHPENWASTQLNLANALQYLPSSHPAENLAQAVEIYQELLGVRTKEMDPVGYARLLANQANALAHLGVFGEALTQLEEAHRLFHWHGEPELAAAALEQVGRINERRAENRELATASAAATTIDGEG